jgi:hypothetical protein
MSDWRQAYGESIAVGKGDAETPLPVVNAASLRAATTATTREALWQSAEAKTSTGVSAMSEQPDNSVDGSEPVEPPNGNGDRLTGVTSASQQWRDIRDRKDPDAVLSAAVKKLGSKLGVFAETSTRLPGITFADRSTLGAGGHLLIWQNPPSLQVFKSLLARAQARHIYLVGGCRLEGDDAPGFLRRLLGVVRFAVNQREGKAEGQRVAAALGTTTLAVALGLTILRKVNLVDWFAEDGVLYLDILDQPSGRMEELPEFRQLANSLREISEFRKWCSAASLKEIQLATVPNQIELAPEGETLRRQNELYACEDGTIDRRDDPLYSISPYADPI